MERFISLRSRTALVIALGLVLGLAWSVSAQKPPAPKVPITFADYHGYTGTVDYLQKVAAAYPHIADLVEIGRSTMERPIYVLVLSNMKTGATIDSLVPLRNPRSENVKNVTPMKPYQGKPGQWIDGGTHGNEYTGTEVCLYIIDKLVSGYGADAGLTRLVDDNVFYICPIVNPDGVYNSVEKGISQRANTLLEDNDHDGKVNEDGPEDIDGDGVIAQFRYKDPKGGYVISDADPRLMVRLAQDETTTKPRYSVITENIDNDKDGKRGEDPESGIDVNRNFPEGWYRDDMTQGGTGYYPSSSPESRAILEFFTNHTNILMVQSFHTSGGFTYRPYARWPDSRIDPKDLGVFDRVIGRKYLELIGETAAATQPAGRGEEGGLAQVRRFGAAANPAGQNQRPTSTAPPAPPRGFRHPYNDERRTPYGYGVFLDWAYGQFGSYAMSTELWNWQKDTKGLPGYAGENDRAKWEAAFIAYQEKALGGKGFVPWKPFKHPELGDGEVGGWVSKYSSNNAIPGDSLLGVCDTHWQFERFKATLLPKLEITSATARVLYATSSLTPGTATQQGDAVTIKKGQGNGRYRIVEVTATVANTGPLATQVATGTRLRGNREDVAWLLGDRDKITYLEGSAWVRLGVLDGTMAIPGYTPPAQGAAPARPMRGGGGFGARGEAPAMPGVPADLREQTPPAQAAQAGPTRTITWLVAVEGDTPLKVVLSSQRGGTVVKDVAIQQSTRSAS